MTRWMSNLPKDENGRPYIIVDNKKLRYGYTTGTCAAAASKTSAHILLRGEIPELVEITLPDGTVIGLEAEDVSVENGKVSCAVRKDSGDDIDATDGLLIYSEVSMRSDGKIVIYGGEGVGVITRNGLDQPVGSPAINSVPLSMIREALEDVCDSLGHSDGLTAKIYVPGGEGIAMRTFNPRLGIENGISILGTTGMVEPMSETAFIGAIRAEMKMKRTSGQDHFLIVPGNYGRANIDSMNDIDGDSAIKCSNFIGATIDYAMEMDCRGILLVGNIGKLVKIAGGIMNTHSRWADCRMEIMAANSIMAGADAETAKAIMSCISTDDALDILCERGYFKETISSLIDNIMFHLNHRTRGDIPIGVILFSSKYGKLGESANVPHLIDKLKEMQNK